MPFLSLLQNICNTWTKGATLYDPNHWTLMPLLRGGFPVTLLFLLRLGVRFGRGWGRRLDCGFIIGCILIVSFFLLYLCVFGLELAMDKKR